jgi:hypothetical protein
MAESILNQPPSDNLWTEPESAANQDAQPEYPYNNATVTESGHSFEMDDTPSRERVRLQHRSGTFIEMHPNGDEVHKVYGDGYEIIIKNKNVLIKGSCNITIEGNCNMQVLGDFNQSVKGDYNLEVAGRLNHRVLGDISISSDEDVSITANENFGGAVRIAAADNVTLSSDLVVSGAIAADMVTAETRINAGTGVYAGILGVYSTGPITSLISVQAPLGSFTLMTAILMTDTINTKIYKTHIHPTPKGPSGLPKLPMV